MKAVKMQAGMVTDFQAIKHQINYLHQSKINVGDLMFLFKGDFKISHHFDVVTPPKEPAASLKIIEIRYKSKLHRFFKYFINESIKWIRVECLYMSDKI